MIETGFSGHCNGQAICIVFVFWIIDRKQYETFCMHYDSIRIRMRLCVQMNGFTPKIWEQRSYIIGFTAFDIDHALNQTG